MSFRILLLTMVEGKSKMLKRHTSIEDLLTEGSSSSRVTWTEKETKAYVDVCVRAKKEWRMEFKTWGSRGYKNLMYEMGKLGYRFTHAQLKNKWDVMQKDWKAWTWLKSQQSGLEWDECRRTIIASDDWWEQAMHVNKHVKKFRETGLEVKLEEKYQELFGNKVASGSWAFAPTPISIVPSYFTADEEAEDDSIDATLQEDSGHSDDLQEPEMFGPNKMSHSNGDTTGRGQKKKRADDTSYNKVKRSREQTISEGLQTLSNILNATAEIWANDLMSNTGDNLRCSIKEVMEDIQQLQGLTIGDKIYIDACLFMREESNREMYVLQPNAEAKLLLLRNLSEERQKEKAMRMLPQNCALNLGMNFSTLPSVPPGFPPSGTTTPNFQQGVWPWG